MDDARGGVARESADMHFVNDEVLGAEFERAVLFPLESVGGDVAAVGEDVFRVGRGAVGLAACHREGVWIEEDAGFVETMPGLRIVRAVHAVAIFEILRVEIENDHGKHIADAEFGREGNFREWSGLAAPEEHECAVGGVTGEDGKIDATSNHPRPVGKRVAEAQPELAVAMADGWFFSGVHGERFFGLRARGCCA